MISAPLEGKTRQKNFPVAGRGEFRFHVGQFQRTI
jgi:hypothetical protein